MYWYYKYAFIGIAIVLGIALLIALRSYLPSLPERSSEPAPADMQAAPSGMPMPNSGRPGAIAVSQVRQPATLPGGETVEATSRPSGGSPADSAAYAQLEVARKHLELREFMPARQVLEAILQDPGLTRFCDAWVATADLLSQVNTHFMLTDAPCPEKTSYLVQRGDSVWKISRQMNVTMPMIVQANQLDPADPKVMVGQVLSIFRADWRIRVTKSQYILELLDGEKLIRIYHIGTGMEDRTPVGTFRISTKERNPIWTNRGKQYEFGHPENVLGTRWMGLEPVGATSTLLEGYGIHGTREPESIGKAESNGCVRMLNEEVEQLFDLVPYFTPVEIQE